MKRCLTSVAVAMLLASSAFAQSKATAENVPVIPHEIRPFLKLPAGLYLGEVMGVATNSKGSLFVYTRSGNTSLLEFDKNGNYVREIGKGNYGIEFAHSVRVDKQDNIWTVDEGTNMVIKFIPAGKVVMVLGRRDPPLGFGASRRARVRIRPTRIHVLPPDRCRRLIRRATSSSPTATATNRVVKYSPERTLPRKVGSEKSGKALGEFFLPHGLRSTARQRLGRRPQQLPLQELDNNLKPNRASTTTSATAGPCASRRVRINISSAPTPIPTAMRPAHGTSPARSTRWSWTARSSASSASRARAGRVPGRPHDGLPQSQRDHRGRRSNRGGCRNHAQPQAQFHLKAAAAMRQMRRH